MPQAPEARRDKFAAFVVRAVTNAQLRHGWSRTQVMEATGLGKTTFYRWMKGDWTEDLEAAKVRDFCDGLDVSVEQAFRILWPSKHHGPIPTEPDPLHPDLAQIARRITDPNTPDADRHFLLESVRLLAARANSTVPKKNR
jgi:transcriptional regulator with XRE-family HTH domain